MKIQEIFINNLKIYRKKSGLTQAQLATYLDKSFNYINGIECGVSFPPPDVIDRIAEILKIKSSQLFEENGCAENIIRLDKSQMIADFTESVYNRLKDELKNDIQESIEKSLKKII